MECKRPSRKAIAKARGAGIGVSPPQSRQSRAPRVVAPAERGQPLGESSFLTSASTGRVAFRRFRTVYFKLAFVFVEGARADLS